MLHQVVLDHQVYLEVQVVVDQVVHQVILMAVLDHLVVLDQVDHQDHREKLMVVLDQVEPQVLILLFMTLQ